MTDEQKIEAEKQELNLLVNRGVSFDVERTIYRRPKGLFGILKKRIPTKEKLKFRIQEPTLSTLDRISSEAVEMIIDESIVFTRSVNCISFDGLTFSANKRVSSSNRLLSGMYFT